MLIRNAEVEGRIVDVHVAGEQVEIDAQRAAVLPGLVDHHIHVLALGASLVSVDVSGGLESLRAAPSTSTGWIRAIGYPDDLDRWAIDAVVADRPIRVQHRSGSLWVLNSAALAAVGLDHPDGRLFRRDDWLRDRIPSETPDVAMVGRLLAARGVTGLTDATPTNRIEDLQLLRTLPQRVMAMTAPGLSGDATVKLVVGDHELPSPEALAAEIDGARPRRVALHCATRVALLVTLAAFDLCGAEPGDRIEHGAVMSLDEAVRVAAHGLVVVTQPSFVVERRYLYEREVEPYDLPDLWRCRSLIDAGVRVAGSTDAPYGSFDPWNAIAAASRRELGPAERVSATVALNLFLTRLDDPAGPVRCAGSERDLVVLDRPLADALGDPSEVGIVATIINGSVVQ